MLRAVPDKYHAPTATVEEVRNEHFANPPRTSRTQGPSLNSFDISDDGGKTPSTLSSRRLGEHRPENIRFDGVRQLLSVLVVPGDVDFTFLFPLFLDSLSR